MKNVRRSVPIGIVHAVRILLTWLILTVIVSNFNLITIGLLVLAFWKPFEACTIWSLLLVLIFTGTKARFPRSWKAARNLFVTLMKTPEEETDIEVC